MQKMTILMYNFFHYLHLTYILNNKKIILIVLLEIFGYYKKINVTYLLSV